MGTVLAITSQKGGVGKTTLALNLGYALARRGWRTLVVDADPQGGIALSVSSSLVVRPGLADLLRGSAELTEAIVETRMPDLRLMPVGTLSALGAGAWSGDLADGRALEPILTRARADHDVVLVDTAPGLGGSTLGVLRNADWFLVPLQAEPLAGRAVRALLAAIDALHEEGAAPSFAGIVLTMLQSRQATSLEVAQESWRLFPAEVVIEATVPRDAIFLEASAKGVPVALLHRRPPPVSSVFDQIAAEVETRIGLASEEDDDVIPLVD